jgi:hypothetical protein
MSRQRHEIPTHLDVEDRAIYGLTIRQVMYLTVGAAGGYGLWNQWPGLAQPLCALLVAVPVVLALIFALFRPAGRPLDEWIFVVFHHLALPKRSVWRVREPDGADWSSGGACWEELRPELAWQEEGL